MVIKKKNSTFDTYQVEMSYKELQSFQAAGRESGDPVADEGAKAIEWYFANEVPPPGVDEHPAKSGKDGGTDADEILQSADELAADLGGIADDSQAPVEISAEPDAAASDTVSAETPPKAPAETDPERVEVDEILPRD